MKNEIEYYSTDKLYKINKNVKNKNSKITCYIVLIISIIGIILGGILLKDGVDINGKDNKVSYSETGSADYTVYLKDNTFYDKTYLTSKDDERKYIASLINTVNTKFNYEVHADTNLDFVYKYKLVATLKIMDKDDQNKILYSKNDVLVEETTNKVNSNNIVINEDAVIDYNAYNSYVNEYKSQFGVSVNAELVVSMVISTEGTTDLTSDMLSDTNTLQITIPLSEQTIDVTIDTDNIDNSAYLSNSNLLIINNSIETILSIIILFISIIGIITTYKLFKEYNKNNIYKITLNKILREYDGLIVNGKNNIVEKNYTNVVRPEKFSEMVDAAQNLNAPILFYEVIPGEKCFFVITKENTLYKFRLTKAYLEREEQEKNN